MFIYKIENKINGKLYIGKTQKSLEKRFAVHKEKARAKYNCHLYDSMNHYGFDNFEIKVIEECRTENELNKREIYWIKFLKTLDRKNGYNMTVGGTGGDTFSNQSEEGKKKRLEKQRISMLGKNKGKKISEKQKEQIRKKLIGRKASLKSRKKMSISQKKRYKENPMLKLKQSINATGRAVSKKTREKIRQGNIGKKKINIKNNKVFCIADIHGSHKALMQCLERSKFDYNNDTLICLGDVADGWTETFECFDELLKIKNLIYIRGNHDQWLKDWLKKGKKPDMWTMQGGQNTINSYFKNSSRSWKKHLDFLSKTKFYYIDDKKRVFVHGGISQKGIHPKDCDKDFLCWDRELWDNRHNLEKNEWKEVYVGHTSIWRFSHNPIKYANVWFMDTGGGWEGKLSIMDIDTKKVWQSDVVKDLYKDATGRNSGMSEDEKAAIIKMFNK